MKRASSVAVAGMVMIWLIGAVLAASSSNTSQAAPAPGQQMSEAAFKNVTALKGIPVDEFMGTMGLFSAALSVCCGDCHTGAGTTNPKWEDDPPRKRIARRMVDMVNAINRDNFNGRQVVTCWTCHRGSLRPLVTPTIDAIYSAPIIEPGDVLARAASGVPTVDELFARYIQAVGGAAKVASLTGWVGKGTAIGYGEVRTGSPFELYAKPNQLAVIVHQREGDLARTYDGQNAYVQLPLTVVEQYPLTAGALEGAKLDAQLSFPGRIKDALTNWRVSYPSTIDDKEVDVVQGTGAAGLIATFYFDKQSGLLVRMIRYANSAVGRVPTQIDYSDYRDVNGVKLPFKWTFGWVGGRDEFTMTEAQPNVQIDAARFARPVPRGR